MRRRCNPGAAEEATHRELGIAGAFEISPPQFRDDRGVLTTPFHAEHFAAAVGRPSFRVAQTISSRSHAGVVRGVHFTAPPSATAKIVHCVHGEVLDIVVDLRLGSPTFGAWDAVVLDDRDHRTVYLPPGVGHAFVVRAPGSVMSYLISQVFDPAAEREVSVHDPALALPIPHRPLLSERDRRAPFLAALLADGSLPSWSPPGEGTRNSRS